MQATSSIEVYNIIRELHEICKRIYNVIDTVIINKCQINRLWNRLNLFLKEFEKLQSENDGNISNTYFKDVKILFLQIASHIESYVIYGPFKKLISNNELEKAFENYNSNLVYFSFQLGLVNLPFINNKFREMEDQEDKEEDNEYFNKLLNSAMKSDNRLLSFLGRVTEPEMIIEAISTLEDIINEDIIDPESQYHESLPNGDDGDRKLIFTQLHSQEIISSIRNYKKPRMNRKKYVNIDNIVYVCEHLKKMAQGLTVESKNWQIASWDIEIWEILSVGPFSKIYKAFWLGLDVAIKEMSYQINRVRVRKEFYKDVKMWYNLSHPNVLSLYGAYQLGDYPFVVIPLMKNGNLINYIEDKEKLSLLNLLEILIGISSGMEYLHAKNVVHGDLMARNILLDEHLQPHICDFGFSKCRAVVDHHSKMKRLDSLRWTANEVHESFVYTKKSDVYSFAMLCYELFTWGSVPFQNLSERFLSEAVIAGKRPEYPEGCPMAIWKLMERMWNGNPEARPDFSDITRYLCHFKAQLKRQALQNEDSNSDSLKLSNDEIIEPIYSVYTASPVLYNNDTNSNPSIDSPYMSSGSNNNNSNAYSNRVYQRSPARSPRLISGIEDISKTGSGSGSGTGSIELNTSVSPSMALTSKFSPVHTEGMPVLTSSSSKSIAIPVIKNAQGRPVVIGNSSGTIKVQSQSQGQSQGQGRSHRGHAHSLSSSFSYGSHSNFSHSPSSTNAAMPIQSMGVGIHPVQLTSEMLPERLSSKQIHSKNGKPINVVQSNYRQRSTSTSAGNSVGPTSITNSQPSPKLVSPDGTTKQLSNIRVSSVSSSSNIPNLKRVVSTNRRYHHNQEEEEIDSAMVFAPNKNGYLSQTGYDLAFKDIEDEMYPTNMYLTRAEREEIEIMNELSFSDEDDFTDQFIDEYLDDDYIDIGYSQPVFNEMDDNYNYRIQKMFEDEFELSTLYDNDNDEQFQYLYKVDDSILNGPYDNLEMGINNATSSNSNSNNNYPYSSSNPNYNKRRSSQSLAIDTTRKSRSRSRSHHSVNNPMGGNSRSRSRSKSRPRSKSRNSYSNKSRRPIMDMEPLEGTNSGIPTPTSTIATPSSNVNLYQSQSQGQSSSQGLNQGQYHMNQEQPYQTPPTSRPHSPYIYDDGSKEDDNSEKYNLQNQNNNNPSQSSSNSNNNINNLLQSMNNMKIVEDINLGNGDNENQSQGQSQSSTSEQYYSAPSISKRTEGVYRCDIKKDITFSFHDDEDISIYYPKDEYCLSNLKFPGINPNDIPVPTFRTSLIEQICMEVPTDPIEKKDFAREMLLNIYMKEFKERFGEFKFEEVIKKNRIEFNTYGFSDWSYKRSAYKVLIDIIKYTHIKHLFIRNCRFGDPAIVALAKALIFNDEFTIIDITFCSKRSRPPQENNIMDIIRYDASNLDPSWVLNTNVTAKSGQLFANLIHQSKNLKAIHLRNAAFGNECAIMMANALHKNKYVEDFELTNCEVHDTAAVAFAEALKHNKVLLRLILQQNPIEDKGAIAISSALRKNMTLKYLLLQKCGLTSKSMSSFTLTFLNNLGLELIKFSSNNIGNEGAKALAEGILANSHIKQLWIDDCNIGKKGIQAISKALDQNVGSEVHVGSVLKFWEKKENFNSRIIIHKDLFN